MARGCAARELKASLLRGVLARALHAVTVGYPHVWACERGDLPDMGWVWVCGLHSVDTMGWRGGWRLSVLIAT